MERFGDRTEKNGVRVDLPEEQSQRFIKRTGVVLRRGDYMEGNMAALLFFKDSGTTWVYIPGASRGSQRFGGALEPLVWGRYQLYQSKRRMYIKEVEVAEDFWELRRRPDAVIQAVRWAKLLERHLIGGYPYNDLLALFYWAQKALLEGVPNETVNARFLWRWLHSWGIAPDLFHCSSCGCTLDGTAGWLDNSFVCSACSPGSRHYEIGNFAEYALSKSFIPRKDAAALLEQARPLQELFVKNLDENR
ncbi:MAG: DNA repair protein RecO [Pyramidobacter sp.]|jgi:DNA repair protein RecO (recombination protein O)